MVKMVVDFDELKEIINDLSSWLYNLDAALSKTIDRFDVFDEMLKDVEKRVGYIEARNANRDEYFDNEGYGER